MPTDPSLTENSRQAMHRYRAGDQSRREFIEWVGSGILSLTAPSEHLQRLLSIDPGRRLDVCLPELHKRDEQLTGDGPVDQVLRCDIRDWATAFIAAFSPEATKSREATYAVALAYAICCDTGLETRGGAQALPDDEDRVLADAYAALHYSKLLAYGEGRKRACGTKQDFARFARAAFAVGHVWRNRGDELGASEWYTLAHSVLKERCDGKDPDVARLKLQSLLYLVRLGVPWRQKHWLHAEGLAMETRLPGMLLAYYHELAASELAEGNLIVARHWIDCLEEEARIEKEAGTAPCPRYNQARIDRPRIHWLLESAKREQSLTKRDEAIHRIKDHYRNHLYGHRYLIAAMDDLAQHYDLKLDPPTARYDSPLAIGAPRFLMEL